MRNYGQRLRRLLSGKAPPFRCWPQLPNLIRAAGRQGPSRADRFVLQRAGVEGQRATQKFLGGNAFLFRRKLFEGLQQGLSVTALAPIISGVFTHDKGHQATTPAPCLLNPSSCLPSAVYRLLPRSPNTRHLTPIFWPTAYCPLPTAFWPPFLPPPGLEDCPRTGGRWPGLPAQCPNNKQQICCYR